MTSPLPRIGVVLCLTRQSKASVVTLSYAPSVELHVSCRSPPMYSCIIALLVRCRMYYTCLTQRDMQGRKCQCNDAIGSLSSRLVIPTSGILAHCVVTIVYHRARPSRTINEDPKKKKTSGIMSVVMLRVPANASPAGIQVHLGLVSGRPLTRGG